MQNFSAQDLIKKGMSGTPTDQKIGKIIMGTAVVGAILAILYFLLPYLTPIFQNIESIASALLRTLIYVLIGGVLIIFARKQVRNVGYFADYLSRLVFNGIITYDPFLIQEKQIMQAKKDVEKMMTEKATIDGKYVELETKLKKYDNDFKAAGLAAKDLKSKGAAETNPKQLQIINEMYADCLGKQQSCKNYIDSISPIANDMNYMREFIQDGYRILTRRIGRAADDLAINKDIFESASTGAMALERMKRAMVGDIELNSDAEKAQMAVMQRTALLVGQMRVSMDIISSVTQDANIEEGGRLALARQQLEQLNLADGEGIPMPTTTASFQGMRSLKEVQVLKVSTEMPD